MPKLIILRGYPGSGKTTIGKRLAEEGIGRFIDHNSILTFVASIAGDDNGIYDDIASLELAITRKLLNEQKNVIVARGFSKLEGLKDYETVAAKLGIESVVIRLEVDRVTLSKRVNSKERLDDFNPTVTEEALNRWLKDNPLVAHPTEKIIDNTQHIEEVVREIITKV